MTLADLISYERLLEWDYLSMHNALSLEQLQRHEA